MKSRLFLAALALGLVTVTGRQGSAQEQFPYQIFERYLEPLVQQIGMPGLSAVIVQDNRIAWSKNYGFADVERKVPTSIHTPYPIGGITQAFTGVLMGVCIDRFRMEIDERDMRNFVPAFPTAETSVRQVLSHATGGRFRYDVSLYSSLTSVVESPECFRPELPAGHGHRDPRAADADPHGAGPRPRSCRRRRGARAVRRREGQEVSGGPCGCERSARRSLSSGCEGPQLSIGVPVIRDGRVQWPGLHRQRSRATADRAESAQRRAAEFYDARSDVEQRGLHRCRRATTQQAS